MIRERRSRLIQKNHDWRPRTSLSVRIYHADGIRQFHRKMRQGLATNTGERIPVSPEIELFESRVSYVLAVLRTTRWRLDEQGSELSFFKSTAILSGFFGANLERIINFYVTLRLGDEANNSVTDDDLFYLATIIAKLAYPVEYSQLPPAKR